MQAPSVLPMALFLGREFAWPIWNLPTSSHDSTKQRILRYQNSAK